MVSRFLIKLILLAAIGAVAFTFYIKKYGSSIDHRFTVKEMTLEEYELYKSKKIADYVVNEAKNIAQVIKIKSPFSSEEDKKAIGQFDAPQLTDQDRACNKAIAAYFSDKSREAKQLKDKLCAHNKN